MNKLVYLHELDSVRNSKQEVEIGQQALFEEVVHNGNIVVVSFNQITDSQAFLYAIRDDKSRDAILNLFYKGRIRVSRFRSIRTPSQYVQNCVQKCLDGKVNFLFSALPFKQSDTEILKSIRDSISFNDPTIFSEKYREIKVKNGTDDLKCEETIERMENFIRFIINVSMRPLSMNPRNDNDIRSLNDFLNIVIENKDSYKEENLLSGIDDVLVAGDVLKQKAVDKAKDDDIEKAINSMLNTRTEWYNQFDKMNDTRSVKSAEAIIDLCHGYTTEESIFDVSKHYNDNDFLEDFENRFNIYFEINNGLHNFHNGDNDELITYSNVKVPKWKVADRVLGATEAEEITNSNRIYEHNYKNECKSWHLKVSGICLRGLLLTVFYILVFCVLQIILNFIQSKMTVFFSEIPQLVISVAQIIIFGVVSTIISKVAKIPDILDSLIGIVTGIYDWIYIISFPDNISYKNLEKETDKDDTRI